MLLIKSFIYILIFCSCTYIGVLISNKYSYRLKELKELKNVLNTIKTKIRFTNEPLKEVFDEISCSTTGNISILSKKFSTNLAKMTTKEALEGAVDSTNLYINKYDKQIIKDMAKTLGKTDLDGQINELELVESFIKAQINDAQKDKDKNQRLYKSLGVICGIGIIIILI